MKTQTSEDGRLVGSRIKQIRMHLGLTQKEFAGSLGIVQGFLSGLERDKKAPSDTLLIALCHLHGINSEWLYTGQGDMLGVKGAKDPVVSRTPLLKNIPKGFPEKLLEEDIFDYVSLPEVPDGCYAIINYGDFMAPTIRDGDLVIFQPEAKIDNRDVVLVNNRWGEPILRRFRTKGDEIFYASDNPAYAPFKPDPATATVGKVIDVWRKIQL
jgi:SOS-response transcriptional repressor LexA